MNNTYIYNEDKAYNYIEKPELLNLIDKNNDFYILKNNCIIFKKVGIIFLDGMRYIIFPKGYKKSNNRNKNLEDIVILIKTLRKYYQSLQTQSVSKSEENDLKANELIDSAMYIIEKYLDKGIYYKKNTIINGKSMGRVDWNKTVKGADVFILNNNPFYFNTKAISRKKDYTTLMTHLHKIAVNKSLYYCGFLYGKFFSIEELELDTYEAELKKNKVYYEEYIKDCISKTYNDQEIKLFKGIASILFEDISSNKNTPIASYTSSDFHNIWEKVVSYIFQSEYDYYKNDFPDLVITYDGNKSSRKQIPDVVYKSSNDHIIIIDAKYYDIQKNMPSKDDFLKQFFYEMTMNKYNHKTINALVFNEQADEKIRLLGSAKIKEEKHLNKYIKEKEIFILSIDQMSAFSSYVHNEINTEYRQMICEISETKGASQNQI